MRGVMRDGLVACNLCLQIFWLIASVLLGREGYSEGAKRGRRRVMEGRRDGRVPETCLQVASVVGG